MTSGSIWVGGSKICEWDQPQICVLVWTVTTGSAATQPTAAGVEADQGHNWWTIATGSPEAVASYNEASYWAPESGNCDTGCAYATVVPYVDGVAGSSYTLRP